MDLSFKSKRRLVGLKQYTSGLKQDAKTLTQSIPLASQLDIIKKRTLAFWLSLTTPQRIYLSATLVFMMFLSLNIEISLSVLALFCGVVTIGLAIEFWPKFLKMWDSILGKTLVLVFYAILANFSLASAAGLVNEVSGVSAAQLSYTHNMALILHVPTWFLVTTTFSLVLIQLLVPFYLVLLLLLKPFGIHGLWHSPEYKYIFSTALIRYVWIFFIATFIVVGGANSGILNEETPVFGAVVQGYVHADSNMLSDAVEDESAPTSTKPNGNEVDATVNDKNDVDESGDIEVAISEENDNRITVSVQHTHSAINIKEKSAKMKLALHTLIAHFIYHYEADIYSRCEQPENTRIVELNDYEILVVSADENREIGFSFDVIACRSPGIGS